MEGRGRGESSVSPSAREGTRFDENIVVYIHCVHVRQDGCFDAAELKLYVSSHGAEFDRQILCSL